MSVSWQNRRRGQSLTDGTLPLALSLVPLGGFVQGDYVLDSLKQAPTLLRASNQPLQLLTNRFFLAHSQIATACSRIGRALRA